MVHAQDDRWSETLYDTRPSDFSLDIAPDERIGASAPPRIPASRAVLRFLMASALSGAWAAAVIDADIKHIVSSAKPVIATAIEKARELAANVRAPNRAPVGQAESPIETAALPKAETEMPPIVATVPVREEESDAAAAAEPVGETYTEQAEAAEEPADKKEQRKQATAAGLSPDLPNVLLSRLSKEDFKNAAYAIRTALAKTADDAKFIWPVAPARHQAKFEVHFVTGAASGCRRYVVTVTKDRWSSTAAALERCGATMARAS